MHLQRGFHPLVPHLCRHSTLLTLNAPPVNALSSSVLSHLSQQLSHIPPSATHLILQSQNPNVFSAGLDIHALLLKDQESQDEFQVRLRSYFSLFQKVVSQLLSLDIPTASVISGSCPAGGTVLALCTDYRVVSRCSPKLLMGLTEVGLFLKK